MKDFHNGIHQSALRLQRTVKNYLLILELEQGGKTGLETGLLLPAKVHECLRTALDSAVEREGRREDITLRWKECPIWIPPSELTQLVEELVDNALKFSGLGTPVNVSLGSDGVLLVADAGRGMSEEEISKIGAFRQFDRQKHKQQGLGLGLTLVQTLASRNGARFSLESKLGQECRNKFCPSLNASDRRSDSGGFQGGSN